jgi:RNA polymerase sigma-70 factor (ECF subfamily)
LNARLTAELLGCLLDEHGGALALYAAQWTENADDCVQEALIELARQPNLPDSPVAWLYRVVRNRAIGQHRASRRRERREELAARLRARSSDRRDIETETSAAELAAAIDSLSEELREVMIARTWGGLNFEEIARLAGCSTSTAHRRYEAGLAALRERLTEPCHTSTNNCQAKPAH